MKKHVFFYLGGNLGSLGRNLCSLGSFPITQGAHFI